MDTTLPEAMRFGGVLKELKPESTALFPHKHQRHLAWAEIPTIMMPSCCPERPANNSDFQTCEQDMMKLSVSGSDILNYHNWNYSADDIAPVWKDCHMWLWKAVSNARTQKRQPVRID
jgi:hypothetical protein